MGRESIMTRVLVAGESWVSESTHYKGFDSFQSVVFETGIGPLKAALEANGIEVVHMPAHECPSSSPPPWQLLVSTMW